MKVFWCWKHWEGDESIFFLFLHNWLVYSFKHPEHQKNMKHHCIVTKCIEDFVSTKALHHIWLHTTLLAELEGSKILPTYEDICRLSLHESSVSLTINQSPNHHFLLLSDHNAYCNYCSNPLHCCHSITTLIQFCMNTCCSNPLHSSMPTAIATTFATSPCCHCYYCSLLLLPTVSTATTTTTVCYCRCCCT